MKQIGNFRHTLAASYIGYITQAIVNNFTPLLFVTFNSAFNISMLKICSLITVNFMIQLCVDLLSTFITDKIGYRIAASFAHFSAFTGFILLGTLPYIMSDSYAAILISTVFLAVGGGTCEVVISPIVEACPTDKKSASMSLLHSFYCWGQVLVVVLSTLYFVISGISNWRYLSYIWGIIPLFNGFYFLFVPINKLVSEEKKLPIKKLLGNKVFYVFLLLMLCSGASELAMSQWASAFAEMGLNISKTVGDLIGPTMFAIFMGISRVLYAVKCEKIELSNYIMISGILCVICYLTAAVSNVSIISLAACALTGFTVGIMWPGVYSLAAAKIPAGGTSMFALLALAGDLGCSVGPNVVGIASDKCGGNFHIGFAAATLFPLILVLGIIILRKNKVTVNEKQAEEYN